MLAFFANVLLEPVKSAEPPTKLENISVNSFKTFSLDFLVATDVLAFS